MSAMRLPDLQNDVRAFHAMASGSQEPDRPTMPSTEKRELRARLLREEAEEAIIAIRMGTLSQVAQELVDVIYVVVGAANAFGIDLEPVWLEVHAANMAKKGGLKRADGKMLKPHGWRPPDVEGVIARQLARREG